MLQPVVADMAHFNTVDMTRIAAAGIRGVIHKATQGLGYVDPLYHIRRSEAVAAGLLWGAYNFATGDNVARNVARFLEVARPDATTLMALDFEDNEHSQMSAVQAYEFLDRVDQAIGRTCWIYGGNRILEHITPLARSDDAKSEFFAAHPLWLAQYKTGRGEMTFDALSRLIRVPAPWRNFTLLQYTGDSVGPRPHTVDGLEKGADLNLFVEAEEKLAAVWPGGALPPPAPTAVAQAEGESDAG